VKSVYLVTAHDVNDEFEQPDKLPAQFGAWEMISSTVLETTEAQARLAEVFVTWRATVE